jgi:hypothetical protein
VGLWLAYSAIFATPAGEMNDIALAVSAVASIVLAIWARQTDPAGWHSATNLVLGAILLFVAVMRWTVQVPSLLSFWVILFIAIAIAIIAFWAVLYRPEPLRSPAPS